MIRKTPCKTANIVRLRTTSVKSRLHFYVKMILAVGVFICLIVVSGCQNIELKKKSVETIPLKFEKGNYDIVAYRIKYPEKILDKETFWQEFDAALKLQFKFDKKYLVVLNEDFFKDYKLIQAGELLKGEDIINKVASSLTFDEIEKLKVITDKKIKLHSGTVQEILNIQIYFLRKILADEDMDKSDPYNEEKLYTELYKEELINILKLRRQKMLKIFERISMELMVEIEDLYKPIESNFEYKKFYATKDVVLQKEIVFDSLLATYNVPILISSMKEDDLTNIVKKEISLKNKFVIINNKKYNGYKYTKTGDLIIFAGGEEEIAGYSGYHIKFSVQDKTLKGLLESPESNLLKRIFGGK